VASKLAASLRSQFDNSFTLLRTGILDDEQRLKLVSNLLGVKEAPEPPQKVYRLEEIFSFYIQEKSCGWNADTKHSFERKLSVIQTEVGNKPIDEYTRKDMLLLRDKLSERFAIKTCNEYLSLLSSAFKQATRHDIMMKNIAEGLVRKKLKRPDAERKRFEVKELQHIVDSMPLKRGLEWRIYVPVIAMFSGLRREEICQLQTDDIRMVDGVWVFDINNKGDKEVKTAGALRLVPIHSELLKLGIVEYAESRKGNLWGFKKYRSSYGSKFGNWFSKWKIANITVDELKCFHSFRHSFTDTLKQSGEAESIIAELVGHVVNSMTFGRYGKRYRLDLLSSVVGRLDYKLDLSRLDTFLNPSSQSLQHQNEGCA